MNLEGYKLFGDRVLVRPMKTAAASKGGILIPEKARSKIAQGIILAKGQDTSIRVNLGDVILYAPYAGISVTLDPEVPPDEGTGLVIDCADILMLCPPQETPSV